MQATIKKLNTSTVNAQGETFNKYGFVLEEWKDDVWVNVVDWNRVYDNEHLSEGDEIQITKPEHNPQYNSWEADFVEPNKNGNGTQGYSHAEQAVKYIEMKVMPALREIYKKLEDMEDGGKKTTKPEDVDEAFAEYAETEDDKLEDLDW